MTERLRINDINDQEQLNQLEKFLHSQNPLIVISGKKGAGKTRLLHSVVKQFNEQREVLHLHGNKQIKPRELLQVLCDHSATEAPNPRLRFEEQLALIVKDFKNYNKSFLLVIDDAHLLPYSILAAVSYLALLQEQDQAFLHVLLTGHPALREKVQSLQARPIPEICLSTLNSDEAKYKLRRLFKRTKRARLINNLFQSLGRLGNVTQPVFSSSESSHKHSTLQLIWQRHQVRVLSITGLVVLIGGLSWSAHHVHHIKINPILLAEQNDNHNPTDQATVSSLLASTPPRVYYTVELVSSHNPIALEQFVKHYHLRQSTQIHSSGNAFYTLSMGRYVSFVKAKQALSQLPKPVLNNHPWIKSHRV